MSDDINFSILKGKVLKDIHQIGDDRLTFVISDTETYSLFHVQGCCENVHINDITGNLSDLIGSPILMAEEASNHMGGPIPEYRNDSWTWTFYKLATIKGYVTIRWIGTSNGYYSESVEFR